MLKPKISVTLRQVVTVLIIVMWAVSFLADLLNPKYDPPDYVNPLIMLVGGYLFATTATKDKEKDKDKDKRGEERKDNNGS